MIAPQYHPIVGGYERAAERLSAGLVARGCEVTVVTDRRNPAWRTREVREGVEVRRLWCLWRPRVHLLTAMWSLAVFLLGEGRRFQIWHAHDFSPHAKLAIFIGRIVGRPVVLKLTTSGGRGVLARTSGAGARARLAGALLRRVSAVVALSEETRQEAVQAGVPAARVHVFGNGVDADTYRPRSPEERSALKSDQGFAGRPAFIAVGRLVPDKNIEGLLEAWASARSSIEPDWLLVVLGGGEQRASLGAKAVAVGVSDSVRFVGEQKDVHLWLGASDVYVSSSNREGLSNTLLEAMASGLPSVATRVSGVPQLIDAEDAGIGVDIGNVAGLAGAIVQMASDAATRLRQGSRARAVIESSYTISRVAELHERLYRQLQSGEGGA